MSENRSHTSARDLRTGSAVFIDMVGFSELSARLLATHGRRHGAEQLHARVEDIFARLDGAALDAGAKASSYAGDAATYWFDADAFGSAQAALGQAHWFCHHALGLAGHTGLRISLASGKAREAELGDGSLGTMAFLSGPVIDRIVMLDSLPDRPAFLMCPESETGLDGPDTPQTRPVNPAIRSTPRARLPTMVAAQNGRVVPEIRPVTAMFIALRFDDGSGAAFAEQVASVQRAVDGREGSVLNLNADAKGAYLSCVFGAPVAHESDGARALDTALDLLDMHPDLAIGLADGSALCGMIGPHRYDVIGEAMTRAARLMQAAEAGEARVTPGLAQTQQSRFAFGPVADNALLTGRKTARSDQEAGQLVERQTTVSAAADALAAPAPICVVLEGPAGFGKSSLMQSVQAAAPVPDAIWLRGGGEDMSQTLPYHAWRPILRSLLAQDRLADADKDALTWAAGLSDEIPMSLTAISGSERTARLAQTVQSAIADVASDAPVILCFDDGHWIDTPSYALLRSVFHGAGHLRLILAKRPSAPPSMDAAMLLGAPDTTTVSLDRLSDRGVEELAATDLGAEALSDELARLFKARTGGSPLFVRQIAKALRDRKMVLVEDGRARAVVSAAALDRLDWLESVEAAIIAGIDRLPDDIRQLARAASVHGRSFDERSLGAALGDAAQDHGTALIDGLQQLVAEGVLVYTEAGYAFSHPVVQQTIADGMTVARRRKIDARLADWWSGQSTPEAIVRRADHLGRTIDSAETAPDVLSPAIEALTAAADSTAASDANMEAAGFLGDAIALSDRLPDTPEERRRRLTLRARYGYALSMLRGYGDPTVEAAYEDALKHAAGVEDSSDLPFTLYGMFSFYASRGDYAQAMGILRRMWKLQGPDQLPVLPSLLDHTRSILATLHGRPRIGAKLAQRSIDRADELGDGVYFTYAGAGDWRIFSGAWLALCNAVQGDWNGAERAHDAALSLGQSQRFAHAFVEGFSPLPVLARAPVAAEDYAHSLIADAGARGFALFSILGGIYLGWAQGSRGQDTPTVRGALDMQLSISRAMKLDSFNIWYSALAAEARLAIGEKDAARDEITAGHAALARGGSSIFECELHRADAQVALAEGQPTSTVAALLEEAYAHAMARKAVFFAYLAADQATRCLPDATWTQRRDSLIERMRATPAPQRIYDGPLADVWPSVAPRSQSAPKSQKKEMLS